MNPFPSIIGVARFLVGDDDVMDLHKPQEVKRSFENL